MRLLNKMAFKYIAVTPTMYSRSFSQNRKASFNKSYECKSSASILPKASFGGPRLAQKLPACPPRPSTVSEKRGANDEDRHSWPKRHVGSSEKDHNASHMLKRVYSEK